MGAREGDAVGFIEGTVARRCDMLNQILQFDGSLWIAKWVPILVERR